MVSVFRAAFPTPFCSIFQNLPDYLPEFFEIWQNFTDFATFAIFLLNFQEIADFFKPMFCEHFEIAAVQKFANLVELEESCQTNIFLQNFVLIQPRTSPPKFCKFFIIFARSLLILLTQRTPAAAMAPSPAWSSARP